MNRVAGFIAGKLGIRIIGEGSAEGTIRLKDKGRGDLKTLWRIMELMAQQHFMGGHVVISHCLNAQLAEKLRELIAQRWQNCDIQILPTRGLDISSMPSATVSSSTTDNAVKSARGAWF